MKVVIVGKGMGWENAPLKGEIWGVTQLINRRDVSRVIDMNDYSLWGDDEKMQALEAREKALALNVPYYDLATYPLKAIIEHFKTDYFSNTVDYALALAIFEGFTEIDLYGVNMLNPGEYSYQKPGVDFWCGVATGKGIKVSVFGKESTIMRTHDGKVYGYGISQNESLRN